MEGSLIIEGTILLLLLVLSRILYVVHKITTGHTKTAPKARTTPARTLICVGSGGHTTEILALVKTLDLKKYSPRYYVVANTDKTSHSKLTRMESEKSTQENVDYFVKQIPRSRTVNQSYVTSVFTTLYSILYSVPLVFRIMPDLILCNGPGTCIPICAIAFLLKVAFICDTRIVFIESYCRTQTFSLSGKILMYIADNVVVQWPSLKKKLKRAEYIGQLM